MHLMLMLKWQKTLILFSASWVVSFASKQRVRNGQFPSMRVLSRIRKKAMNLSKMIISKECLLSIPRWFDAAPYLLILSNKCSNGPIGLKLREQIIDLIVQEAPLVQCLLPQFKYRKPQLEQGQSSCPILGPKVAQAWAQISLLQECHPSSMVLMEL